MYHRVAIVGIICAAGAAAAEPVPLSGKTLSEIVPGASVQLDTPLGTKLPVKYTANGLISGEAGALAWFLGSETDRGRWWVADDKLCQKFFKWFDAEVQCLRLKREGDRLFWSRDDGKTGTATLIAAAPIEQAPYGLGHRASSLAAIEPALSPAQATAQAKPIEPLVRATTPAAARIATPQPSAAVATKPAALKANVPAVAKATTVASTPLTPTQPLTLPGAPKLVAAKVAMVKPIAVPSAVPQTQGSVPISAISSSAKPVPARIATAVTSDRLPVESISFRVSGVHPRDVLNVRQGPSTETAPVGAIPPFADGVKLAGECQMDWCPIRHGAVSGWVNRYYLREED